MIFTLEVNFDGMNRKFDLAIENASDLREPLNEFGKYLKQRALNRYKEQDFEPLKQKTVQARVKKGIKSLEGKLVRDVRNAYKRQNDTQPMPKGFFQSALAAIGARPSGAILGGQSKGVTNRLAVLSEFQRRHRGGSSALMSASGKPLSVKQLSSLDQRTERAVNKALGKPILGKLPETLVLEVGIDTVTLTSLTTRHFTLVHNDGGTAGHGAKIPQREALRVEQGDIEILGLILKDYIVKPLET